MLKALIRQEGDTKDILIGKEPNKKLLRLMKEFNNNSRCKITIQKSTIYIKKILRKQFHLQ